MNRKRIVSAILSIVMTVSMLPMTAFATTEDENLIEDMQFKGTNCTSWSTQYSYGEPILPTVIEARTADKWYYDIEIPIDSWTLPDGVTYSHAVSGEYVFTPHYTIPTGYTLKDGADWQVINWEHTVYEPGYVRFADDNDKHEDRPVFCINGWTHIYPVTGRTYGDTWAEVHGLHSLSGAFPNTGYSANDVLGYLDDIQIEETFDEEHPCDPGNVEETRQTVTYDEATNTLTLNNATLDRYYDAWGDSPSALIYYHPGFPIHEGYETLTIRLIGDNVMYGKHGGTSGSSGTIASISINGGANLNIVGNGTLTIRPPKPEDPTNPIWKSLWESRNTYASIYLGPDCPIIAENNTHDGYKMAKGTLTISDGATVTIEGNWRATHDDECSTSAGIVAGDVIVTGDDTSLIATGGTKHSLENAYHDLGGAPGMVLDGDLLVKDGATAYVEARCGRPEAYGISADTVTVDNATLTAISVEGEDNTLDENEDNDYLNKYYPQVDTYAVKANEIIIKGENSSFEANRKGNYYVDGTGESYSLNVKPKFDHNAYEIMTKAWKTAEYIYEEDYDSDYQNLSNVKLVPARDPAPDAPTGLVGNAPTYIGRTDGSISGVDDTMEWSTSSNFDDPTDVIADKTTIENLAPGTYYVRVKGTDTAKTGEVATVIVPESTEVEPAPKMIIFSPENVEFDQATIGYSGIAPITVEVWNNTEFTVDDFWFEDNDGPYGNFEVDLSNTKMPLEPNERTTLTITPDNYLNDRNDTYYFIKMKVSGITAENEEKLLSAFHNVEEITVSNSETVTVGFSMLHSFIGVDGVVDSEFMPVANQVTLIPNYDDGFIPIHPDYDYADLEGWNFGFMQYVGELYRFVEKGSDMVLPPNRFPLNNGKEFLGWKIGTLNEDSYDIEIDPTSTLYAPGESIDVNQDDTTYVFAIWGESSEPDEDVENNLYDIQLPDPAPFVNGDQLNDTIERYGEMVSGSFERQDKNGGLTSFRVEGTSVDGTNYNTESETNWKDVYPFGKAGTYTIYATSLAKGDVPEKTVSLDFTIDPYETEVLNAFVTDREYIEGDKSVDVSSVSVPKGLYLQYLTLDEDFTATAEMLDDTAGNDKPVTVTVTLTNPNYTFANDSQTATYETKVDIEAPPENNLYSIFVSNPWELYGNDNNTMYVTYGKDVDGQMVYEDPNGGELTYYYEGTGETEYGSSDFPNTVGTYKVSVTSAQNGEIPLKTVTCEFEVSPARRTLHSAKVADRVYEKDNLNVDVTSVVIHDYYNYVKSSDYTVIATMDDDTVGENKAVTVTVTFTNPNFTFTSGVSATYETTVNITEPSQGQEIVIDVAKRLDGFSAKDTLSDDEKTTVTQAVKDLVAGTENDKEAVRQEDRFMDELTEINDVFLKANGKITEDYKNPTIPSGVSDTSKLPNKPVKVNGLAVSAFGSETLIDDVVVSLKVEQIASNEAALVMEVKPQQTIDGTTTDIENSKLKTPISFNIYLPSSITTDVVKVVHKYQSGGQEVMILPVKTSGTDKYITITATQFSEFEVSNMYELAVIGGNGDGNYAKDDVVTITAESAPTGKKFKNWTTDDGGSFENANSSTTTFTMPDGEVTITANYENISTGGSTGGSSGGSSGGTSGGSDISKEEKINDVFKDVKSSDWYYDYVYDVVDKGLFSGTSVETFSPNENATRAMVWTVLARMANADLKDGEMWYSKAQKWAMNEGVSDGTEPDDFITREQFVAMLWRNAGSPEVDDELDFADSDNASDYAYKALVWAVDEKIITGKGENILEPQGNLTRAEMATILSKLTDK